LQGPGILQLVDLVQDFLLQFARREKWFSFRRHANRGNKMSARFCLEETATRADDSRLFGECRKLMQRNENDPRFREITMTSG
jgi:hypothetical protein